MIEKDPIELLQRIQQVEAPAHIRTRILANVERIRHERIPVGWAFALAATLLLLVTLNMNMIIGRTSDRSGSDQAILSVSTAFDLSTTDQLYYD